MTGKRAFLTSTVLPFLAFLLPVLAIVLLSYTEWSRADQNPVILNGLPISETAVDLTGRWNAQFNPGHVSASMSIRSGEESGNYQVELTYSHCLGTQIATRDARFEGGRLVLAEPFTYDDIATSLGVDRDTPPTERPGIDAFRVVALDYGPVLIPEHYFEHASIRYFTGRASWRSGFLAFIHRNQIDDPERLARIPADSEYEIVDVNSIFYR